MTAISSLSWGIKESLVSYVESLGDGVIDVSEPATRVKNLFKFPLEPATSDFDEASGVGSLVFSGAVLLTGHWGSMRIEVLDPKLTLTSETGSLAILVRSVLRDDAYVTIATVEKSSQDNLSYAVKLTADGCDIFGRQYQPGQELDPILLN